jgi:hypothetical protein
MFKIIYYSVIHSEASWHLNSLNDHITLRGEVWAHKTLSMGQDSKVMYIGAYWSCLYLLHIPRRKYHLVARGGRLASPVYHSLTFIFFLLQLKTLMDVYRRVLILSLLLQFFDCILKLFRRFRIFSIFNTSRNILNYCVIAMIRDTKINSIKQP